MKKVLIPVFGLLLMCNNASAQSAMAYSTAYNVHSHNDYWQVLPFYTAYGAHCASIEADIYLENGTLYVAHDRKDITSARTLRALYLDPIREQMKMNGGKIYADSTGLQLLIDLKTEYRQTLPALEKLLKEYADCFDSAKNPSAVKIVITGSMPEAKDFGKYASFLFFDGRPNLTYSAEESQRIALVSLSFGALSEWNGLGRMTHDDYSRVKAVIDKVHAQGKKIRFWGCPDTKTAWNTFMKMGVDFINTDQPTRIADFMSTLTTDRYSTQGNFYSVYKPTYESDGMGKTPKNVILLISDGGAGQAGMWAAATANGGSLNLMQARHIGLMQNNPADDYTTDSAGAGTAMATGSQTRNRRIGTDSNGDSIPNITEILENKGFRTGIVSNDGITGATPSAFYAHEADRGFGRAIAYDLLQAKAHVIIGAGEKAFAENDSALVKALRRAGRVVSTDPASLRTLPASQKAVFLKGDDYKQHKRLIEETFNDICNYLDKDNDKGFFLMVEGAKVDKGGHACNLPILVDEYLSFDRVVGKALEFADRDKQTLVIILSDHETGGLTLLDGDYKSGTIIGQFATNDHTGVPVLVYSYGPSSQQFGGFFHNYDLPRKIMDLMLTKHEAEF